jgi:hypothetical protein
MKNALTVLAGTAALAFGSQAMAVITLTHTVGGTAASYVSTASASTTATNLGDANFRAETSGADQVFDNAWFWRINGVDTREFQFSAVGAVDASAGNTGTRTYATLAGGAFSAVINYTLTDGPIAGTAVVSQVMTITNTSAGPLSLALFNYVDADMGASAAADSASLLSPDTIRFFENANPSLGLEYQGVGANLYQGGTFNSTPGTLLTNALVNDLGNTGLPQTNVDVAGALQWNLSLAQGQSIAVTLNMSLTVPGAGAFALLGLAGVVGGGRRRRA